MIVKECFSEGERLLVSDTGRVWTTDRLVRYCRYGISTMIKQKGRELKIRTDKDGYSRVRFTHNNKRITKGVHRLVAKAFISNPNNLPCINHKNENKKDNYPENLEWCDVNYNNHYNNRYSRIRRNYKSVIMLNKSNEEIKTFKSIGEAAKYVNGNPSNIGNCCNGRLKVAYGFVWKFDR